MEDVALSKNSKTRAIVGFRAISKNRSAIGMRRKVVKKETVSTIKKIGENAMLLLLNFVEINFST